MRKHQEDKIRFLTELQKTGNVFSASSRSKIPRSTIYRWKNEDKKFSELFLSTAKFGRENMSDIAESVITNAIIADKDVKAAQYFLNHNNPRYAPKKPEKYDFEMADNLADLIKETLREKKKKQENEQPTIT
jgi:hypothetical protein